MPTFLECFPAGDPKALPVVPQLPFPDIKDLFADSLDEELHCTILKHVVFNCPFCHWLTQCGTNFLTLSLTLFIMASVHVFIGVVCVCQWTKMQCSCIFFNTQTFSIAKQLFLVKKKVVHMCVVHETCIACCGFGSPMTMHGPPMMMHG